MPKLPKLKNPFKGAGKKVKDFVKETKVYQVLEPKVLAKTVKMDDSVYSGFYDLFDSIATEISKTGTAIKKVQTNLKKMQKNLDDEAKLAEKQLKLDNGSKKYAEIENKRTDLVTNRNTLREGLSNSLDSFYEEIAQIQAKKIDTVTYRAEHKELL